MAALLCGLYAPSAGDHPRRPDVLDLDGAHLRAELMACVPQEPPLLGGTLRDNVALGAPARPGGLRAAAALVVDFAAADWELGQRQRVALARVLRASPVVVLDEFVGPARHRAAIIPTLRDALAGRTLILITHRPSALRLVDRVVELGEGGAVLRDYQVDHSLDGSDGTSPRGAADALGGG